MTWIKIHSIHITESQFSNLDICDLLQGIAIALNRNEWIGIIIQNAEIIYERSYTTLAGCKKSIDIQLTKRLNGNA